MADTILNLVDKVYVELGDDAAADPVFSPRLVLQTMNRKLGVLAARGITGTYWHTSAITLVAGTSAYTYTPPAHSDSALLLTTLRSVGAVRRASDGQPLRIEEAATLRLWQENPETTGDPTHIAFYVTAEKNSLETSGTNLIKALVYPEPTEADTLDFQIGTTQSMRFALTRQSDTVALADGAERALVLLVAAELIARCTPERLARLQIEPAWAAAATADAVVLIEDEAERIYQLQLPDDIVLQER